MRKKYNIFVFHNEGGVLRYFFFKNVRMMMVVCVLSLGLVSQPGFAQQSQKHQNEGSAQDKERAITISEGIAMVLKDNRLIKESLFDKDMAVADSLLARSALLPHLNISASETYYKFQPAAKLGPVVANTSDRQFISYGFDVYQTLFDFGKSLWIYQASKEMVKASEAGIESVKRVATLEFIVAYFNLLEAEKMISVAEKEVESLSSYLNDIKHLYEQGVVVKNDLLPAEVRLADAKQKLIAARHAREVAQAVLNNILALPLRGTLRPKDFQMRPPELPDMEEAWKVSESQRPELAFFNNQLLALASSVKAKAVGNLPTVYADAGYSYSKNRYQVHQDNTFLQLGAKVDLYDGGAARAELLKERAREKQVKDQKDKLVEDIKLEIEDSSLSLKDACEKIGVAKEAAAQAHENVRVNRVKYTEGASTPTEVLEAISLETKAQTNYYSNDYELKRGYAKLMYSMGIDLTLIYKTMENKNEHVQ